MVFDELWFKQNQWWLLPYVSHDRDNLFIDTNKPLIEIAPDHVSWLEEPGLITTEFHVHHVYGRRLYRRLSPLWNLMHRIDMSSFGRAANLNFGFDTLTAYPDADPETDTVDGEVGFYSSDLTWSGIHDATDGAVALLDIATVLWCTLLSHATNADHWKGLYRSFFLFKTSGLTASASISAATLSLYGYTKYDFSGIVGHIVSSNPASDTDLGVGDYDCVGSTSFGSIDYATYYISGYNDISLNASGIANISKTGISKFAGRTGWDMNDSPPVWVANTSNYLGGYFADDTTANNGKDPKLVVTYSAGSTFVPKCIFL